MSTHYHVSTRGDDGNPGTTDRPFATLKRARDAVRRLSDRPGATVWIHGGDYELTQSLELTAEDSGSADAQVTYRAVAGESVRLLGGRAVTNWERVQEPSVLDRLHESARPHVWQANLNALGLTEFGEMISRGFSRPIAPAHIELFYNGQPMTLARWPNQDFATISSIPEGTSKDDSHGGTLGVLEAGFYFKNERPRQWGKAQNIWGHGYWAWDWANSYEQIDAIDLETGLIKTKAPYGLYGFRAGQRIFFLNILEELDEPGEWYLDRPSGMLYFWPPGPLDGAQVMLSLLAEPMIKATNTSHVTIHDLTLEYTRGCAIRITGGSVVRIAGCTIANTGNYGVMIEGGTEHSVIDSEIYNNGDGGVWIAGGDRKALTPGGHCVQNNHLHHQARWSRCYCPSVMVQGIGHCVAHNRIHDHPHCAILFNGNDILIERNEIFDVCSETGDVGAIYTGRDFAMRGNVIRYKFLHHIFGPGHLGSIAVYLDDCASGTIVFGNVFYKTQMAAFIGGGRDTPIENNIFVDCHPAVQIDGRGLDPRPVWRDMVTKTMKDLLIEVNYKQPPYCERYPEMQSLAQYIDHDKPVPPEGNRVVRNIFHGGEWLKIHWHAEPEMVEISNNFTEGDPKFIDPASMNFQLQDDSPVWELGFKRLPIEEMGLQRKC